MNFKMTAPCNDCPFRKEGGVRLTRERTMQIADAMLSPDGKTFACHKTTGVTGKRPADGEESHCAGALIFAEKNDNQTQYMRIMGRLGQYKPDALAEQDAVFDDLDEMLDTALDARHRRARVRSRP